jgi:hypothetical protein
VLRRPVESAPRIGHSAVLFDICSTGPAAFSQHFRFPDRADSVRVTADFLLTAAFPKLWIVGNTFGFVVQTLLQWLCHAAEKPYAAGALLFRIEADAEARRRLIRS